MRRIPSLEVVFATLVAGCGSDKSSEPMVPWADDDFGGCENGSETLSEEIDAAEVELVTGGLPVVPDYCDPLCARFDHVGHLEGCSVSEPAKLLGSDGTDTVDGNDSTGRGSTGTGGEPMETEANTHGHPPDTEGDRTVLLECTFVTACLGGRGHESLRSRPLPVEENRVGAWLAATAHGEAASVVSFLALREELRAHGAPEDFVERALRAAMDEVRHARVMTRLARRNGRAPVRPRFGPIEVRDLESIAIENAVEGCVRETWAALEACHQAQHAADSDIRRAMTGIASDETRHAELAHDLHAWLAERLDAASRERVAAARQRAIEQLEKGSWHGRHDHLCRRTGLPDRDTMVRLIRGLRETVWV